ncbi:hypothetical protein BHE74_00034434 [Ensete ventricosum]|nr:hypothetical protein BHE74_00034434 [Ensete ventricosum]RZR89182.1 hypothetical protein BHM03_00016861 [Ensete ventricosum]
MSSPLSSDKYVVQLYVEAEMSVWPDSIRVRKITYVSRQSDRYLIGLKCHMVDCLEVDDGKPLLFSWLGSCTKVRVGWGIRLDPSE